MNEPGLVSVPGGIAGFQAAVSAAYFPYEITQTSSVNEFRSEMATGSIGPLHLSRTYVSAPFHGHRRVAECGDERRTYVLMLPQQGGDICLHGKRSAVSRPGDLVLINANQPLETEQRIGGISLAVSIPAGLVKARFLAVDDWCLRPLNSSEGSAALLRECLLCYWRSYAKLRPTEYSDLTAALVHLIGAAFRCCSALPTFDSRSTSLHFLRVRDLVAAHLDSHELSVDFVSSRLGISKSYLFMIMNAANTTLGRFILEQRLQRSRDLLADPTMMHRPISEIAFSVGFRELSHFSRRFAERFGRSPRAYRVKACAN
jgi:AraC-like DNA-binding protein